MKKSKTKKPKFVSPLQLFYERHSFLSYQKLSDICAKAENCSRSNLARLINGEIKDKQMESEMRRTLAQNLPKFLLSRGFDASKIDAELSAIFNKGEYQPMIENREALPKAVQKHFGFSEDPFALLPDSKAKVFISPDLQEILDTAIEAVKLRKFICILGEIGSGKTILRMLIEDHVSNNPSLRIISPETFDMSKLTSSAISRKMLETLGETTIPRSPVAQTDKLRELFIRNSHLSIALLFDEIHRVHNNLNKNTIPALKNYWEMLRHGFSRDLGIILIGQPHFETTLNEMPEIKKRVELIKMPEFQNSALAYLEHRLNLAGANSSSLFDEQALAIIQHNSPTPLSLGNTVNKALILSYENQEAFVFGSLLTAENGFAQMPEEAKILSMRKRA